jgi:hypothetical protein
MANVPKMQVVVKMNKNNLLFKDDLLNLLSDVMAFEFI